MEPFRNLLEFLNLLQSKRIQFALTQSRDDALMVSFGLVGERYEIEFMEDHLEVFVCRGHESVDLDLNPVIARIEQDQE